MSIFARLRHKFSSGFFSKPHISSLITPKTLNPNRTFAQQALKQAETEIEIDPRKLPADYDPSNFDPSSHRSPPSDRVFRLVEEVSNLTLSEACQLGKILMTKIGVNENDPPVIGVLNPSAAAGLAQLGSNSSGVDVVEEKKEEKTMFELKLEGFEAASKLKVIKEIRGVTDLGLKEAKDLVEKTPSVFKRGVPKEDAEAIIEKLKAVGAKVVME